MGTTIVRLGDQYLEWSSITDAPCTFGMGIKEFRAYYRDEYGRSSMNDLERRLERVEQRGHSSLMEGTLEDHLCCNRAGWRETFLTTAQIQQIYCVEKREPVEGEGVLQDYGDDDDD